nr:immunoglobulin light chain junction region [Macaca mulatta]MOX30270.1 immunoglobulin light chain junction region [Macaca mulatta]MOX30694.1 immunoglobulin light chain junction region [Macaca mulatta]MOX31556.1 immunoglobulin light chain junction region [Macaca mulatta]MOX32634.1 immunoglobulin light chain junction region [Macaca mulatta]
DYYCQSYDHSLTDLLF